MSEDPNAAPAAGEGEPQEGTDNQPVAEEQQAQEPESEPQGTEAQATPDDESSGATGEDDAEFWRREKRKAAQEAKNLRDRLRKYEAEEEKRRRAERSELDNLRADKEKAESERAEYEKQATEAIERAQKAAVRSQATLGALQSGAKPERIEAILRLADLTDVLTEDGEPDEKAIQKAVGAVLKDYPEFRGVAADVGGPSNPPGEPPKANKSVWEMSPEEFAKYRERAMTGERVTLPGA